MTTTKKEKYKLALVGATGVVRQHGKKSFRREKIAYL